jgi:hypothetical protein
MFDQLFNVGYTGSFLSFLLMAVLIVSFWKIFQKAGYPGWGVLIPIYNLYVLVKMANYDGILILLFLIPVVNVVFLLFVYLRINRAFGQDDILVFGLIFLPFIFFPILGLGSAKYVKNQAK